MPTARRIVANCRQCDEPRIVVTHGTDTMVETARRSLADANLAKTIVLTGAMIPYAFGSSDGLFNLGSALSFAQVLPPGVYVAMNGMAFPWDRCARTPRRASSKACEPMAALTFLGAARTVTGSKYLLEVDDHRLLVDCGLFQGLKSLRERNWARLPVQPASIARGGADARAPRSLRLLPRLVAQGFRRPHLLHRRHRGSVPAGAAGRRPAAGRRRPRRQPARLLEAHAGAAALHRERRVRRAGAHAAGRVQSADAGGAGHGGRVHQRRAPARARRTCDGAQQTARRHASSSAAISGATTGRCCRIPSPASRPTCCWSNPPTAIAAPADDDGARWRASSTRPSNRSGKVIIPAFAIGRVEEVLYWLKQLEDSSRVPVLPVYVDSPMAVEALEFYRRHARRARRRHAGRSAAKCRRFGTAALPARRRRRRSRAELPTSTVRRSSSRPAAWPPAAACCTTWPRRCPTRATRCCSSASRPQARAAGACRRRAAGEDVTASSFRCPRAIERLNAMSAHADAGEIVRWLRTFPRRPAMTYLVHGEPSAQEALKRASSESSAGTCTFPATASESRRRRS